MHTCTDWTPHPLPDTFFQGPRAPFLCFLSTDAFGAGVRLCLLAETAEQQGMTLFRTPWGETVAGNAAAVSEPFGCPPLLPTSLPSNASKESLE